MNFSLWPQVIVSSITLAAILIPVALSWAVIFRTTQVLNFAVGQYAVLGAFIFYTFQSHTQVNWWIALILSVVLVGLLGAATFVLAVRPLLGREPWIPVIVTMGLAFIGDSVIDYIWGANTHDVNPPTQVTTIQVVSGASMNTRNIYAVILGVVCLIATLAFFRYSSVGTKMRAAAESSVLAAQTGIRISLMFACGWAISCALAAVGGIAYTMTTVLDPSAVSVGLLALTPVLLGGLDSIRGVLLGSVVTALVDNFAALYFGADSIPMVSGVLLLVILLVRPYGFFGTKAIVRV